MSISHAEAKMELALITSKTQGFDRTDAFSWFMNAGLPSEVIFRLEELWEATRVIGRKIVRIGKIIIFEIIRFIKENPNLAVGVAVGAAVGALINLIPFLGPLLAPILAAISVVIGGFAGARLDRDQKLEKGALGIVQEVIILARKFFELFAAIFMALKEDFESSKF